VLCQPSCVDAARLSPYTSAPPAPFSPPAIAFSPELLSRITDSVVNAVLAVDLSSIYTLLFSPQSFEPSPLENGPVLVNVPDTEGWSAIHYCASVPNPSTEILDALYRAGADVSLFTTWEHYTPLHCLARLGRVTDASNSAQLLYQFAVHLICDLHAPLSARDRNEETCIHIAAEHGECIDVLYAFLDCDPTGSYRNLRNSRG
jgi:ankyrin repeat protein